MTQDEIKQLRDLADRATPGPYRVARDAAVTVVLAGEGEDTTWVADDLRDRDAEYLAALSPERIKELCDLAADGAAYRARCALATEVADSLSDQVAKSLEDPCA